MACTSQARKSAAAGASRHGDLGMLKGVMGSSRRRESFEPGHQQGGILLPQLGFTAVCDLHGATRPRCAGHFQAPAKAPGENLTLGTPPAAVPVPVSVTLTAFELSRNLRPYLDRLALPFSCFSQASPISLSSGMHTEKVRQSVARTPEAPQSTYPTTTNHRDHMP